MLNKDEIVEKILQELDKRCKVDRITKEVMTVLNSYVSNDEKWITIKPHGEESDDYRRLKLEDGETPKEAIERVYKKEEGKQKDNKFKELEKKYTEKKESLIKLEKLEKELSSKYREARLNQMGFSINKKMTQEEIKEHLQNYEDYRNKRNETIKAINELTREIAKEKKEKLNDLIKKIDIEKKLKSYNTDDVVKKLEQVNKDFDYDKIYSEYEEIEKIHVEKRKKFKEYIENASTQDERKKRQLEYEDWYRNSDFAKTRLNKMQKLNNYTSDRNKAISKILQHKNGGNFNLTTPKGSVLTEKVKKTNELLTGIVNKEYLKDFNTVAKGFRGLRANGSGKLIQLNSADTISTVMHECMHALEDINPKMLANSKAFLEYRTKNDVEKSLKSLTGIKNYKANEMTKADNFFNPYCGKKYEYGTEIMSMGVQRLFKHPEKFYKEDREYFNFVIGNLRGEL